MIRYIDHIFYVYNVQCTIYNVHHTVCNVCIYGIYFIRTYAIGITLYNIIVFVKRIVKAYI